MRDHVHIGLVSGVATFATVVIGAALWKATAFRIIDRNPESAFGQAMLVIL